MYILLVWTSSGHHVECCFESVSAVLPPWWCTTFCGRHLKAESSYMLSVQTTWQTPKCSYSQTDMEITSSSNVKINQTMYHTNFSVQAAQQDKTSMTRTCKLITVGKGCMPQTSGKWENVSDSHSNPGEQNISYDILQIKFILT